jgi:murein L,D-transpeptidase YafK
LPPVLLALASQQMKIKVILKLLVLIGAISTFIFYQYGRSIWHPYYLKLNGKRTTQEVYSQIGKQIEDQLSLKFSKKHIPYPPNQLSIIALKEERKLELWAKNKNGIPSLIDTYEFKGFSGELGPKLKSGDKQIPEGIYKIEYLNPNSSYHLSMKITYPNFFDNKVAKQDGRTNLGGDIFIHGKSLTIGCIPIGDRNIEKLFILVYKIGKENVDVIISPYDMRIKEKNIDYRNLNWLPEKYQIIKNALSKYKES